MITLVSSKQCTTIDNNNVIRTNTSFVTEERFPTFQIRLDDIVKVIRSLDPNKAHRHDEISIRMIKVCAPSISKSLPILFRSCLKSDFFLKNGRKVT